MRAVAAAKITDYVTPLATDPFFKHIGRILSELNDDWPEVVHNLRKGRKNWVRLS